MPPFLTGTLFSGDSSLVQPAIKKTAHCHFCFGMAHCFELRLSKIVKLCDLSLEYEEKIINYWYSQITGQTLFNMAKLE